MVKGRQNTMEINYTECDRCKKHIDGVKNSKRLIIFEICDNTNESVIDLCPVCASVVETVINKMLREKSNG